MTRLLEVWGDRDFHIEIPDDAKVTFGPFSPPSATSGWKGASGSGASRGTLRIYKGTKTTENVMAVFSGVEGFRDTELTYTATPRPPVTRAPTALLDWPSMSRGDREEFTEMVASAMRQQAIEAALDEDEKEEEEKVETPF